MAKTLPPTTFNSTLPQPSVHNSRSVSPPSGGSTKSRKAKSKNTRTAKKHRQASLVTNPRRDPNRIRTERGATVEIVHEITTVGQPMTRDLRQPLTIAASKERAVRNDIGVSR